MQLRDLAPVLLVLACTPKPADTEGDPGSTGAATDGAEVTSATQTDPTSPSSPTIDPTPTSTTATTAPPSQTASSSPDGTTGPDDTATDTSDETGGGGLPGACLDVCTRWDACAPGSAGPIDECVADCADVEGAEPMCVAGMDALWSCVAGLPCEEALKFLNGAPSSCLEEAGAAEEACQGEECGGEIGGDMETCELMQECGMGTQDIACDATTCTCTQDDVVIKQCESDGFCALGFEEQRAAVLACCGWDWTP